MYFDTHSTVYAKPVFTSTSIAFSSSGMDRLYVVLRGTL